MSFRDFPFKDFPLRYDRRGEFDCRMEAVCLQEKFFYFVSVCVPHCSDSPNDRFLSNAFNRCFKLSGVLLKFCRLILGCVKKFYLIGYSWGT